MKTFNKKISVAEYIADFISSLGVDIVPFVQGGAIMKIIDSVGQHKKLKYVACNHEQAVAMFVDGYARVKGFGVGMATSGPGGTNMLTGIACAYYDSIPCLFITGQVGMFHIKGDRKIRQRGFQETDIVSMAKPVTKHSEMVVKGEDVRYVFEKAVHMAKSGRPGPVLIDVPYNVQREMIIPEKLRSYSPSSSKSPFLKTSCEKEAKNILNILLKAERPVLFVGGGVRIAGEVKNTVKLASALKIPVVTTWGAIDVFSSSEPLYLGSPGRYGNISANEIVEKSDVALSLGSRFTTKVIHNDKIFSHNTKVIAVDIDRGELNEGLLPHWRTIQVDLREFLPVLLRQSREVSLNKEKLKKWLAFARELKSKSFDINIPPKSPESHVNPYTFGRVLSRVLGKKDIITSDCGLNLVMMAQAYNSKGEEQRFISAWGNSPMGYSFPAVLGAYFARPTATSVCLIGDGGMQMNIQELQTIAVNKIPVKIFILNNYCYGMMMLNKNDFGGRTFGNEPKTGYAAPDFVKIAKAYGIQAFNFKNNENLETNIKKVLSQSGPAVINLNLHPDQEVFDAVLAERNPK